MRRTAPEVVPSDIEFGESGKMTSLSRVPPPIVPFQMPNSGGRSSGRRGVGVNGSSAPSSEGTSQIGWTVAGIWLVGWLFLGYGMLWPVYMVFDLLGTLLSTPPLSWFFGWFYRGIPLTSGGALMDELKLPPSQVSQYLDTYVQQYGDAALIFAVHDGYPQVVTGLLFNDELGFRDLINARDDAGNTALLYASAKGFRQCAATLLHAGADPDEGNQGSGGRTPLMEAAGGGFKDIVSALMQTPNMTSLDKTDDFGNTALHYAAYHGYVSAVLELLKGNPNKDIKNNYGQTPASYALANKHKSVADLLNRAPKRTAKDTTKSAGASANLLENQVEDQLQRIKTMKEDRHVKGVAEDLHKKDGHIFAPTMENSISDKERNSMIEQISKLNRQQEESELKSHKRIVELLEKSSELQSALDTTKQEIRAAQLNNTEMLFKISDLESKYRSSELRASEESEHAKSLREQNKKYQQEADQHRARAEAAERERDLQLETVRRHEETSRKLEEEVRKNQDRHQKQQEELQHERKKLQKVDEENRHRQHEIDRLENELRELRERVGDHTLPFTSDTAADSKAPYEELGSLPNSEASLADSNSVRNEPHHISSQEV